MSGAEPAAAHGAPPDAHAFAEIGAGQEVARCGRGFERRRDLVVSAIREIDGFVCNVPEGAFYVFPDVSTLFGRRAPDGTAIDTADELAMYLLREAHVATVSGSGFGNDDCIRISFAASEEQLTEALARIRRAVAALA